LTTELLSDAGTADVTTGELDLEERHSLRRVAGLSTELTDITEVEYRQLRLERVVLVGVWTEGGVDDAENSLASWPRSRRPQVRRCSRGSYSDAAGPTPATSSPGQGRRAA